VKMQVADMGDANHGHYPLFVKVRLLFRQAPFLTEYHLFSESSQATEDSCEQGVEGGLGFLCGGGLLGLDRKHLVEPF